MKPETQSEKENAPAVVGSGAVVRHDYTTTKCRWGWNIVGCYPIKDTGKLKVLGVGRGIKDGHEIMMTTTEGIDYVLKVESVKYTGNPPDLYEAILVVPNAATEPSSQ